MFTSGWVNRSVAISMGLVFLCLLAAPGTAGAARLFYGVGNGAVRYMDPDGQNVVSLPGISSAGDFDYDPYRDDLYLSYSDRMYRMPDLSSSSLDELLRVTLGFGSPSFGRVAVDPLSARFVVLTTDPSNQRNRRTAATRYDMFAANYPDSTNVGSTAVTVANESADFYRFTHLDIDPVGRHVYVTDRDYDGGWGIRRYNLNGSGGGVTLYGGSDFQGSPLGFAMDVRGRRLYWSEYRSGTGIIRSAPIGGGGTVTDVLTADSTVTGIAVDPATGTIFYSEYDYSRLYRVDADGVSNKQLLAENCNGSLVFDADGGVAPDDPLLPTSSGPDGFYFDDVQVDDPNAFIYLDPDVAIGYDYASTGLNIASAVLPNVGDGIYELWLWNGSEFVYDRDVNGNEEFYFESGGVGGFRILGIEETAGLDPADELAFVTGLTFVDSGTTDVTMTALVPEPATLGLLALGALPMLRRRSR